MIALSSLSADPHQQTTVLLEDKTAVTITLDYHPAIKQWMLSVSTSAFALKNVAVVLHPNLLRDYRDRIPFGLACSAADGVDPFDIDDFDSGRVVMYLLDNTDGETDVTDVEEVYFSV